MAFERLDTNSEIILKLFLKHETLNASQLAVLLEKDIFDYAGYFCILLEKGYIKNADFRKPHKIVLEADGVYIITTKGKIYFDLKKQDFRQFLKRSVLIPAISSIITSVIVTSITLWLKGLL